MVVPASAATGNAMSADVARLVLQADAHLKPAVAASK
jgi:hypothetical protein